MNSKSGSILSCKNVYKSFGVSKEKVEVLRGVSLTVEKGESIAITGASGSGKSTLLHVLGGLDFADSGEVQFEGRCFSMLSDSERGQVRNTGIGFVYQFHHLLKEFSAYENVSLPLSIRGDNSAQIKEQAENILCEVGMQDRLHHFPSQLSGGERQRVALARALVTQPKCILADEPTGNLDQKTANQVMDLLFKVQGEREIAMVVVTHDEAIYSQMSKNFSLNDGKIV